MRLIVVPNQARRYRQHLPVGDRFANVEVYGVDQFVIDDNPHEDRAAQIRNGLMRAFIKAYKLDERGPLIIVANALAGMQLFKRRGDEPALANHCQCGFV